MIHESLTLLRADAAGATLIAVSIVALFVGAELASRLYRLPVEYTRKATHLGAGIVVFGFPWLISHTVTVVLLALCFVGVLLGGRLTGLLGSIHNVERRTSGAYYYPIAVLGVWLLSQGDPLLFCVPLAIMAVADTGAALVGQRAGETTYQVMDGQRSVEGSMAFFALAFAIVLVASAVAGRPGWPATLLVALVVAALTTSVESVSVRGSDNIGIPYFAWLALEHTERLGLEALGDWVFGMIMGVGVLMLSLERARLDTAGSVLVFLVCTLSFALGGWLWFAPLAALYAGFLAARTPDAVNLQRVFPTTATSMVVVLIYAHTGREELYVAFVASVAASSAMAAWLIATMRRWPRLPLCVAGALAPVVIAKALSPSAEFFIPLGAAALAVVGIISLRSAPAIGRRVAISAVVALLAQLAATLRG